ncbi:MAG: hypothetical protein UT50_C0021G0004 [Candidatus Moranbacteria bacterium GW2011_GWA2_39_41]|nr:MAG: hypothetical protein UT50_C0021G0004 [Candidatus Moranbacteria bacterium GW2011_GWA2_39_41]
MKNARLRRNSNYSIGAFCAVPKKLFLSQKKSFNAGSANLNLVSLVFVIVFCIGIGGAAYLYQVNDIATKGYEIRDLEKQVKDLSKESKKMEIREVELRSMYNIEKASQDLNLVNSNDVTYVEIDGPVAMK